MMRDSPNNSRFSPKKSDVILLEDCRREVDQLRLELENEKLKTQEFRRKFAVQVKVIKEAAEKEKRKLVDDLRSKWELQKTRESQQLKDQIVRKREVEIRQLLRWKDAELRELQGFLQKEREAAVRQARELQKQLAEELLNRGYSSKFGNNRRLSEGDTVVATECQCKLQEVLSKLRWEFDGEQAARIRHLKVELDLERNLFLKYILEGSKWDFTALLKNKPKPPWGIVEDVELEHTSPKTQACRPRSLESTTSKPLSPSSATSRPRSLDIPLARPASPEILVQPVSPDSPLIGTAIAGSFGIQPMISYPEDNEGDSSGWMVLSKESELHCLSPEIQRQRTLPEPKGYSWPSAVGMLPPASDIEALEKSRHIQQHWLNADNSPLVKQNADLLSALQELESRCNALKEENNLLRKSSLPETEDKVKRLKKKNAELAVIAKRLEERAQKLQEANLKVVNTPVHLKGSGIELCKKTFARQRAKDLAEQATALLAKDKQIEALQKECRELKTKLAAGKECSTWLSLSDFDRLLRESQKEVLRLQRQIAIKYLKESLLLSKVGSRDSNPSAIISLRVPGVAQIETSAISGPHRGETSVSSENISSGSNAKEFELSKKRKECENLEQEVRKKQKRCEELETIINEVKSENAKLLEENSRLKGRAAWTDKVESENADLRVQLVNVTEQRDSSIQETHQLQSKLENLEQVLKHMREVAERRQQLEKEHEEARIALRGRQEEVKRLHQAHVEAKKEHEGAVHLLEARVKDLEEKCRSQTKQFGLLSQELERFRMHTGKIDLLTSTLVTSELPVIPCCSTSEHPHVHQDKDVPASSPLKEKIEDGVVEVERLHYPGDAISNIIKFTAEKSSDINEKEIKKLEHLPNSSKSDSQNSPKSCLTPEMDTASEMEELEVDSVSLIPEPESRPAAKLQVFLARYSYNPLDGPNENPEAELPLTAGEYIYIYGEMDDDGFYEGELMDGRRGLVPSNFVERVSDDDLMTVQPLEVGELSHSSCQDISFMSISSVERSDIPEEEVSLSPLLNGLQGSGGEPADVSAVPCPRKLTLIKQLARSIVVGWEPPLVPAGCGSIQSYNIYLDTELRLNVRCGSPTKALIENLDLKNNAYRVSVQSVTENGNSDRLRCSLLVGHGYSIAPSRLRVRSLTATSAEISWMPSNSNYTHAIYLNEEECGFTNAGTYWYAFRNLRPSTQYNVKVESRPHRTPWELPPERRERKSMGMQLTTPSAGPPDAPLDVQVELGPLPDILLISWLPVTIDAAGTSNGVRVTGYAVYADGQKVLEVTSPTAGSVLVGMSQLKLLQVSREVSVRTMSPHGESVDSVPAQIPSALLKVPDSLYLLNSSLVSEQPFGEYLDSRPGRIPRTMLTSSPYSPQTITAANSNAKLNKHAISNEFEFKEFIEHALETESSLGEGHSVGYLPINVSQHPLVSALSASSGQSHGTNSQGVVSNHSFAQAASNNPPIGLALPSELCEVSAIPLMAALEAIDKNIQKDLELPLNTSPESKCQTAAGDFEVKAEASRAWIVETLTKGRATTANKTEEEKARQSFLSPETSLSEHGGDSVSKAVFRGGSVQEFLEVSSEERVDVEDSSLTWPTDENEEREMSNQGGGNVASPADCCSDLSDILEEEEEDLCAEMPAVKKCGQRNHGNINESEGKASECDHRLQPSISPAAKQSLSGKMITNQPTKYSDRGGPKGLTSGVLKHATLELKDVNLEVTNTVIVEGVKSSKKSLENETLRLFVALFEYDPVTMSPNPDAAFEELPFKEGQIIKVFGDKDADGFYRGECNGKIGYIPCNMISEVQVENEGDGNQMLHLGFLTTDTSLENLELAVQDVNKNRPTEPNLQVRRTELNVASTMVAIFDYDPRESSPNVDVEAELTFSAGDVITVYGSMDDDGFYYGELNGQRGLVPSNFLDASSVAEGGADEILSQDRDTQELSQERQKLRKKRRK